MPFVVTDIIVQKLYQTALSRSLASLVPFKTQQQLLQVYSLDKNAQLALLDSSVLLLRHHLHSNLAKLVFTVQIMHITYQNMHAQVALTLQVQLMLHLQVLALFALLALTVKKDLLP